MKKAHFVNETNFQNKNNNEYSNVDNFSAEYFVESQFPNENFTENPPPHNVQ